MTDFSKYFDKYIVLVTNYTTSPQELKSLKSEQYDIKIVKYNDKYVCVRSLKEDDLRDEDYVIWLQTMWQIEEDITLFLRNSKEWIEKDLVRTSQKQP
jgi:sulfur relay (sulfurtransferase) DsrF/TusC family protein